MDGVKEFFAGFLPSVFRAERMGTEFLSVSTFLLYSARHLDARGSLLPLLTLLHHLTSRSIAESQLRLRRDRGTRYLLWLRAKS